MKRIICILLSVWIVTMATSAMSASARCKVVDKKGNLLIMDCGEQAKGFDEKSQVKIKTDREQK